MSYAQVNDTFDVFRAVSCSGIGTIMAGVSTAALEIEGLKGELAAKAP
jgi:hypothetical protein